MNFFRLSIFSRNPKRPAHPPILGLLAERLPQGDVPGLLPAADSQIAREEERSAQNLAKELHGHHRDLASLGRREQAVIHCARRRRAGELEEALSGLSTTSALRLLDRLSKKPNLDREGIGATSRKLLQTTARAEVARAALLLLSLDPQTEDLPTLRLTARSASLAPFAARAASAFGEGESLEALLSLVRVSDGLGRALVAEELLRSQGHGLPAEVGAELVHLVAEVEDPLERGWGAVPLLEVLDAAALVAGDPALAEAIASCLESAARGGWRGGPGPGLGRLPGAARAAEAILEGRGSQEARRRTAQAVLDSHPPPHGKVHDLATSFFESTWT